MLTSQLLIASTILYFILRWRVRKIEEVKRTVSGGVYRRDKNTIDNHVIKAYVKIVAWCHLWWIIVVGLSLASFVTTVEMTSPAMRNLAIFSHGLMVILSLDDACRFQRNHVEEANSFKAGRPIPLFLPDWWPASTE